MSLNFEIADDCGNLYEKVLENSQINSPLLAKILVSRGIVTDKQIDQFLNPNMEESWENPYTIKAMDELANKVEKAIKTGKRILIYGDYDLDGISSTAVMLRGLKSIDKHVNAGMQLDYFIPNRFNEGYGFTDAAISRMMKEHQRPDLIISVDCGVTAAKEIKTLNKAGVEVVVTDHHKKADNYPKDIALIDPAAEDEDSPNKILAGVGVALKLIQVLSTRFGMPNMWKDLIDLATLGTLADVMPLVGQNRALVKQGLRMLNKQPRASIRALLDVAGKKDVKMTSTDVSYIIVPRLNAAGRMDKTELALQLLINDSYTDCFKLALEIEGLNNQRREITEQISNEAKYIANKILDEEPEKKSLVIAREGWHPGVLGIVSAKISETFALPSIIMTINKDGSAHGSGRSAGEIDLHKACMESFDKFIKFGGHKGACGVTVDKSDLQEFSNNLETYMQNLDDKFFEQKISVDADINLHELTIDAVESLKVLEPYGCQNEPPKFLTRNVFIKRARAVGQDHNHLSCNLTDGAYGGQGIMFNVDNIEQFLKCDTAVYAIYTPKTESYQGQNYVKMHLDNIIPCENIEIYNCDDNHCQYLNSLYDNFPINQNIGSSVGDFIKLSVRALNEDFVDKDLAPRTFANELNLASREELKKLDLDSLQQKIVEMIIGPDANLHVSQKQSLNLLKSGKSILSVMPTGRGKSLIFQIYASLLAIKENKMSIFVFPLRALIADQAFHLQKSLSKLGINVCVLTGDTFQEDRDKTYEQIKNGHCDIVLTTPEFLSYHIDKIAVYNKIAFVVVDEAHHLGHVKLGERTAYGYMIKIFEKLNHPQVLAVSATVDDEICKEINTYLPVQELVYDNFERENLYVDDRRNMKCRDDYLVSLCASGQKIVIYVNSRQQTVDLARMIKSRAPHIAMKVGFYNGGMKKEDRHKIEDMFRDNKLSVLIATSAFGEGVNIPDIRHVCLYHLPFSNVEFNQMAGRCGRDNQPAIIHLLYNRADATINTQILQMVNPNREVLGKIFIWIKSTCENFGGGFEFNHDQLVKMHVAGTIPADPATVLAAMDIFDELRLIKVETINKEGQNYSKITLCNYKDKVNLEDSSRFCEGQNEISNFEQYRHDSMRRDARELTEVLRRPILPSELKF